MIAKHRNLKLDGEWVLVTGASSGLGASIARELASRHKANTILVARRRGLLEGLRIELAERWNTESIVVDADLGNMDDIAKVMKIVRQIEPVAAVLNAGVTASGAFSGGEQSKTQAVLSVNVVGLTALLSQLVGTFQHSSRQYGILIVSSLGGETSLPFQAVYGASKAFVTTLAQAVSAELANTNVSVGAILPGGIDTDMAQQSGLKHQRLGLMNSERCAKDAISALVARRVITVPGALNKIMYAISRIVSRPCAARLAKLPYKTPERRSPHADVR